MRYDTVKFQQYIYALVTKEEQELATLRKEEGIQLRTVQIHRTKKGLESKNSTANTLMYLEYRTVSKCKTI